MDLCSHCCTKIENLSVNLSGRQILSSIYLHINCHEILALIGPNGAGKTTLLRAILGEVPYTGHMSFRFKGIDKGRPHIGYVPQKLNIESDTPVTVLDFFSAALTWKPVWLSVSALIRDTILRALEKVSVAHLLMRRLSELSGGELQRVLLAMAITPVPELLLLDEPVSGVDAQGLAGFYALVDQLRHDYDVSIIMASHDLQGVSRFADRLVLLNQRILIDGEPKVVMSDPQIIEVFMPNLLASHVTGSASIITDSRKQ